MGLGKRLSDWSAASTAVERDRDAELAHGARPPRTVTQWLVTLLTVLAPIVLVVGIWGGVVIGRSLEGWARPLGLAVPGWMVVLAAVVSALVLAGLSAGLRSLERSAGRR